MYSVYNTSVFYNDITKYLFRRLNNQEYIMEHFIATKKVMTDTTYVLCNVMNVCLRLK